VAAYVFTPGALSAGASTALYGLFGALIFVVRRLGGSLAPLIPVIVINFALTFAIPGISIAGHVGGFIVGGLVGAAMAFAPQRNRAAVVAAVIGGTLVGLGAVVLAQTAALGG
jgi:membrane associated rhomboid family serine protease